MEGFLKDFHILCIQLHIYRRKVRDLNGLHIAQGVFNT
jgi:hypothetical protein